MINDLYGTALALYKKGWRAGDKNMLTKELHLTNYEAEKICHFLNAFDGKMKHVGYWNGGKYESIEMVEVDGAMYALHGWNGEKYLDCWKCIDEWTVDPDDSGRFTAKPVYRFELEGIDLDELEENSEEWESAVEIVDYDISRR